MISERIKFITKLADIDENIADIGCDHGYVLILLSQLNKNIKLLGIDNKEGPLNSLKENLKSKNIKNISYSLSDGLDDVNEEFHAIIIAGMGFLNIKSIINKHLEKLNFIEYFIVDCHDNFEEVRLFFNKLGYSIDDEIFLKENSIFYNLIRFKKGKETLNKLQYTFGPINLKIRNKDFLDYLVNQKETCTKLLKLIKNDRLRTEQVSNYLILVEEALRNEY